MVKYKRVVLFTQFLFHLCFRENRKSLHHDKKSNILTVPLQFRKALLPIVTMFFFLRNRVFLYSELGTRQHCRDNVTMFVGYCIFTTFVVASPFRHRALKMFRIFSCPSSSYIYIVALPLSRYRCREAKNLSRAQLCGYHK